MSLAPAMKKLQAAMESSLGDVQRDSLIPLHKQAFVCAAKCCDKHKEMHTLQQCTENCQQKVHAANQMMNAVVEQFQERFQRCLMRCDDAAKESLPVNATDKDRDSAQERIVACMEACASEYTAKVPKLKSDCQQSLKQLG